MQKITSIEHGLEVLGQSIDFDKLAEVLASAGIPSADIPAMVADTKIKKIIEANNKLNNWVPVWGEDYNRKYNVWQEVEEDDSKPAGFGFTISYFVCWVTYTAVGERLVVGTAEEALYIGRDFIDLFETAWLKPRIVQPS